MANIVQVAKVPGTVKSVALDRGATVADAIREAGFETDGYQVQLNSGSTNLSSSVGDGDTITLTKQIRGNVELRVVVA